MSQFHEIRVKQIESLTDDAVAITLDISQELKDKFQFRAGQYLTVEPEIDGRKERRSYSICSSENETDLKIGVREVEGGLVSGFLNTTLHAGDLLPVMSPEGRFTLGEAETRNILLLASGSGITPCLSLAKTVLENEPESTVTIIYGNRTISSIMFRDELCHLKDRYTSRFTVIYLLSRESQEFSLLNGRLGAEKLSALVDCKMIDPAEYDAAYLCGPQAMIEDTSAFLRDHGMREANIKFELFGTYDTQNAKQANLKTAVDDAFVDIVLDGVNKRITIDGTEQTVLAAAQSAGVDLPFSCAGGMCCTCRCKIIEGEAEMDVNYSLEAWEIEAGFTLACQARPKSKTLKLDFDAS